MRTPIHGRRTIELAKADKSVNGSKRSIVQFIKFALVGVMNTLVDFLVYTLLVLLFGVDDAFMLGLFTLIAYACGVLNSFILNSRWTFREEYKSTSREKLLFVVINLVSWLVSYGLTWLFTNYVFEGSGLAYSIARIINYTSPDQLAKVVSILAKLLATPIVIIVNFIGNKLFVFTGKADK